MVTSGASSGFTWIIPPTAQMGAHVRRARTRLPVAIRVALTQFAAMCLDYARTHHPWTNRTGAAEAGLSTQVEGDGNRIAMALFHTVYYGIFLELKFGGRDAIIMPTLQAHYAQAVALLLSVLGSIWA